eukprot:2551250-Rhodomonas_salina.3
MNINHLRPRSQNVSVAQRSSHTERTGTICTHSTAQHSIIGSHNQRFPEPASAIRVGVFGHKDQVLASNLGGELDLIRHRLPRRPAPFSVPHLHDLPCFPPSLALALDERPDRKPQGA